MGCIFSRSRSRASVYRVKAGAPDLTETPKVFSWDLTDHPDAKDFVFKDLKAQCKVRPPGSIKGQQFIIDKCEDCSIYLFDNSASVNVDDCSNCCILIGPVDGSVFVRDCKKCTIISVSRQFRTRDCHECKCMLACCTRPIIESSTQIQFGCFDIAYKGLSAQLQSIQLSKFQNFWSDVYDFTPGSGNWEFLPLECFSADLLDPVPDEASEYLTKDSAEAIPVSHGQRPTSTDQSSFCWVVFPATAAQAAAQFILKVHQQLQDVVLLRTTESKLDQQTSDGLLDKSGPRSEIWSFFRSEAHIGLEFCGDGCDTAAALAKEAGACAVSRLPQDALPLRFAGLS